MSRLDGSEPAGRKFHRVRSPARKVRLPKTSELIATQLRRQIVMGELEEGDALPPEAELMATFDVSRQTLREAFRVLEAEGLLSVRRGAYGGARVHTPKGSVVGRYAGLVLQTQLTTLADVYDARALIEPPAVGRTAAQATKAQVQRLFELCDEAEKMADDDPELPEIHGTLHKELVGMSGSRTLTLFVDIIHHILKEANQSYISEVTGSDAKLSANRKANRTHRHVVGLIANNDAVGAEEFWHTHIKEAAALVLATGADSVVDLMTPNPYD